MSGYCISQNLYGRIPVRYGARDVIAIQDEFQESTCTNKTDAPLTGFTYDICHVRAYCFHICVEVTSQSFVSTSVLMMQIYVI